MKQSLFLLLMGLILTSLFLVGCGGEDTAVTHLHPMAPLSDMPIDVQRSGRRLQQAYQFAVANPELSDAIPCYCGCDGLGHTSSYDCYVAGVDEAGVMQFDAHAQLCSICLDITHDTMRMLDEGRSTAEIFTQIEADYARFGPPTIKPATGGS
jgi:hypothetical protein